MKLSCQEAISLLLFGSIFSALIKSFFVRWWWRERESGGLNSICPNNQRLPLNLPLFCF